MAAATWAGRSYAHLALPVPFLADVDVALFDGAICADEGWQPVENSLSQPVMLRRWRYGNRMLVLVVLGWYPLTVTLGVAQKGGAPARRALRRVRTAVHERGGRDIGDAELTTAVAAARARYAEAVATQRELARQQSRLGYRDCTICRSWSAFDLPHCRSCGHRFTPAEDVRRDEEHGAAQEALTRCSARLDFLGRGEGLFDDWPPPLPPRPSTSREARKVVAER